MISQPMTIRVWGPWACFTRPEFHVERVSYPVITPSAARGVLEAILMKPIEKPEADRRDRKIGFRWHILRIGIIKPGHMVSILRNELKCEKQGYAGFEILEERTQRHSLILKNVDYLIQAAIEVPGPVKRIGDEFLVAKYQKMFERRIAAGQCHHRPYLGCREFPCYFENGADIKPADINQDFGSMFRDFDFSPIWNHWQSGPRPAKWSDANGRQISPSPLPTFHARAESGWITVAKVVTVERRKTVRVE